MSIEKLKRETFLKMVNSGEIAHNSDNEEWVNVLIQIGADFIKKEYEEKLRWVPVEEKLPPLNEYVLFKYSGDEYCVGCLNVYGYYCSPYNPIETDHASIHLLSEVTHWRSFL